MKRVISNDELREIILEATNLIGDAVGNTIGPKGNNVLINNDETSPFITNDGVTIAHAIASDKEAVNTILEIIKESALKTNEVVGDGTSTTIVLLQSIIKEGLKVIKQGYNAVVLKKEILESMQIVLDNLQGYKIKPKKKDLLAIAKISANDEEIGKIITEVYLKMKTKDAIKLDYSQNAITYYEIKNGYNIELDNIPSYYFNNDNFLELNNVYLLIINSYLDNIEKISNIINEGIERDKNIIILADDFDDVLYNEIITYKLQNNKNIFLFKLPDYASRKDAIANDLAMISSSNIKNTFYDNINWNDLGLIDKVIINKNELIFINNNINYKNKINILKEELTKAISDYDKDFLKERISKLENGIATIYVGGITDVEKKEKRMRFEDAINALEIAKKGVIVGEGISYLKVSSILSNTTHGNIILRKALEMPFIKLMENAGENPNLIKGEIIANNYKSIYNFKTAQFESINDTEILDPLEVEMEALKNAISIATLLLTTNYLIINDSFQKENIEF